MNNRELLELAAKAAGYEVIKEFPYQIAVSCGAPNPLDGVELFGLVIHDGVKVRSPWNPLDDDGDALRLANKLRMRIEHHICHPYVAVFAGVDFDKVKAEEPEGDDVDVATRLAIVRAAAEIWRGM